jgi:hypothetical protein
VIFIYFSSQRQNRRSQSFPAGADPFFKGGGGGGGGGGNLLTYFIVRDLLFYSIRPYNAAYDYSYQPVSNINNIGGNPYPNPAPNPNPYRPPNDPTPLPNPWNANTPDQSPDPNGGQSSSIVADIFRFVFGDGVQPNSDHRLRCLRAAGYFIRSMPNCTVQAKDLAPFLDAYIFDYHQKRAMVQTQYSKHEGFVWEVLRCFNGKPVANDSGELYYYFPDLMGVENNLELDTILEGHYKSKFSSLIREVRGTQADSAIRVRTQGSSLEEGAESPPILERFHTFFHSSMVVLLGVWNIVQLGIFRWVISTGFYEYLTGDQQIMFLPLLHLAAYLYWYLLAYAIFFFAVPVARYFVIKYLNSKITKRNNIRTSVCLQLRNTGVTTV